MNAVLERHFEAMERDRLALVEKVKKFPEQELSKQPAPGQWSVLQVLMHLMVSDQLTLGYMQKKISVIDTLDDTGLLDSLRVWLLIGANRLPLKFNAPKVIQEKTPEAMALDKLLEAWGKVKADMKSLLGQLEERHIRRKVFKHPIGGRMNAAQAIQVTHAHLKRHIPQIERGLGGK